MATGNGQLNVRSGWFSYAERVLPSDAPSVQKQETRRAFYAGAAHALDVMLRLGEDDVSEDAGVEVLEALRQECRRFVEDVLAGRR
jgi:hypothetical protein